MGEFRVYLIGQPEPALMRIAGTCVEEIAEKTMRNRFLAGLLLSFDGFEPPTPVAIPACRVQMIAEVCQ
jgi:hypothetical protein